MILPNEVLYIILDLLRDEKDYNTLYQCAVSSRFFTEQALILLYQLYDTAPVTGGGSTEDEPIKAQRTGGSLINAKRKQEKTLWKWATMWRSVILSAFDKTYLPYCNYIRYLNLSDLSELLAHSGFKGRTRDHFFTPELYNFVREGYHEPMSNPRHKNYPDSDWMMVKFGSLVTSKTTSIRGLTGHVSSHLISEWLSRLPLLQTLSVWFGESLTNTGEKIHEHCPEFKRLTVYRWMNWDLESTDSDVEKFLNDLRPNTLEHFEILSYSMLGPRSIRAVNSHLNSLTELKLTSLNGDAIAALPSLTAPPRLRALTLTDSKSLALDDEYDSMVTRVGEWIHGCKSLRQLNLRKFVNDAILLSHALREDGPRLTTLRLAGYNATRARSFHEALALQGSLQELSLSGECIEYPEDIEILVQAITQLNDLRVLELLEVSDGFTPDHIIALMPFLPRLERLAIGGDHFDDGIWNTFLCLPKLKYLFINALSDFTVQGILGFIAQLGPDNRGFNLSIMNSTNEAKLTDEEQELIRNTIENSLGGAFDFGLAQDEYSDIDSDEFSDYGPP